MYSGNDVGLGWALAVDRAHTVKLKFCFSHVLNLKVNVTWQEHFQDKRYTYVIRDFYSCRDYPENFATFR